MIEMYDVLRPCRKCGAFSVGYTMVRDTHGPPRQSAKCNGCGFAVSAPGDEYRDLVRAWNDSLIQPDAPPNIKYALAVRAGDVVMLFCDKDDAHAWLKLNTEWDWAAWEPNVTIVPKGTTV